jgi:hypothetical protein
MTTINLTIDNVPEKYKNMFTKVKSFDNLIELMGFLERINSNQRLSSDVYPIKKSDVYGICTQYSETIENMTLRDMDILNKQWELEVPIGLLKEVPCVYIQGITHDMRRYDVGIPIELLNSFENYN